MNIEQIIKRYEEDLENFDISPTLGSCQYKTIEDTYNFFMKLINTQGLEGAENLLNITHSKPWTEKEISQNLKELLEGYEDFDLEDHSSYPPTTISEYIDFCRNESWDLWSAAIYPFDELNFDPPNSPTHGPVLNQMAQSENPEIGIWLAYWTIYFNIGLEQWSNFDT